MRDRNRSLMLAFSAARMKTSWPQQQAAGDKRSRSVCRCPPDTNELHAARSTRRLFQEGKHGSQKRKKQRKETKHGNAASGTTYPFSADNLLLWGTASPVESFGVKGFQSVFDSKCCSCSTAALKVLSGEGVGRAVDGRVRPPSVLGEMEGREGLSDCVGPSVGPVVLRRAFKSMALKHLHTSDGEAGSMTD